MSDDQIRMTPTWQPFSYAEPPDGGLYWLEVERPEAWCDAGDDGRTVGGFTGETRRLVVLAAVYPEPDGPDFECVHDGQFGEVLEGDGVRHYLPLTPPEPPDA